jgi:hypothetical protein
MTVGQVLRNLDTFDPHIVPDVQTYAMIIDAKIGQDPSEAAPFAEQVLERMNLESSTNHLVQPGLVAYSSVINAWSKSRLSHAGKKQKLCCREWKNWDYNRIQSASMLRNLLGRENSNNPFAGQRAELLLQKMLKLYEAGHVDVKPDTISFSSAIAAWTKSGNALAAARTEAILRRMIEFSRQGHNDVKPDTITYASVIDAWAKSGDPLAGKKAESLLLEILEPYNMGNNNVKPDTIAYNSVIDAWANSQDPNTGIRALALLGRMEKEYNMGNEDVKPTTNCFNAAVTAWDNSRDTKAGI